LDRIFQANLDQHELDELKKYKEGESVTYTRHLLWMAEDTHAELEAFCLGRIEYPFALERNAMTFVLLAGAVLNNLWNIVDVVQRESDLVRKAWKSQAMDRRELAALRDRRDGISHGRLDRWSLKADGGKAKSEDEKYPHMPMVTILADQKPVYYQWRDRYALDFPNVLEWQAEVLNEMNHQEYNRIAILEKIRSGSDPNDVVRPRLVLPTWLPAQDHGEAE
jgi:hypothetical protein